MSVAVDASSPSAAIGSGATTVTGAFTPPDNTLLVAYCQGDANNGSLDEDQTVADSTSTTWTKVVLRNGNGGACVTVHKRRLSGTGSSPGSITATLTDTKGSVAKRIFVRVFIDAASGIAPDIGATAVSGATTVSLVTTVNNSWVWSDCLTANATLSAGAGCTLQDSFGGFDSGDAVATYSQTALTSTSGTSVTNTIAGTATVPHNVAIEIIPTVTAVDYAGPWTGPTPGRLGPTGQWTTQPLASGTTYAQTLAGTLTSAAALTKAAAAAKAGALTSSGSLAKQDQKHPAGTLTSAGTVAKQDNKALAAALATSGALSTIKVVLRAFAGTLTSSGALAKAAAKALSGGLTPAGAIAKTASKAAAGTLTAGGALSKAAAKAASGTIAAAGTLAKLVRNALAGALGSSGALSTTGGGQAARADSTPAVTDRRTSTPTVTDERTSTPDVEG